MNPPRLDGDPVLVILSDLPLEAGEAPTSAAAGSGIPSPDAEPASTWPKVFDDISWPKVSDDICRQAAYEMRRQHGSEHSRAVGSLMPGRPWEFHDWLTELETEDPTFFPYLCVYVDRTGRGHGFWQEVEGVVRKEDFVWYAAKRFAGMSANMARMLCTGHTPFIMTDDVFLAGLARQFENPAMSPYGDYYRQVAESEGCDVTGAVYMPGLASYPGDPKAWVRGRGDVARVAEEKNLTIKGGFLDRQARRDEAPPPDIDVADDLVEQEVLRRLDHNPELRHTDPGELYHDAKQSLLPDRSAVDPFADAA